MHEEDTGNLTKMSRLTPRLRNRQQRRRFSNNQNNNQVTPENTPSEGPGMLPLNPGGGSQHHLSSSGPCTLPVASALSPGPAADTYWIAWFKSQQMPGVYSHVLLFPAELWAITEASTWLLISACLVGVNKCLWSEWENPVIAYLLVGSATIWWCQYSKAKLNYN